MYRYKNLARSLTFNVLTMCSTISSAISHGYNPMHLRKSQYSWLQQILITEIILPNWIRCVIAGTMHIWLSKVYGDNPIHLNKSQYSWLQLILITETNSSKLDTMCKAVLWLSKVYGHNCIHLRKSHYSWQQQVLITETKLFFQTRYDV